LVSWALREVSQSVSVPACSLKARPSASRPEFLSLDGELSPVATRSPPEARGWQRCLQGTSSGPDSLLSCSRESSTVSCPGDPRQHRPPQGPGLHVACSAPSRNPCLRPSTCGRRVSCSFPCRLPAQSAVWGEASDVHHVASAGPSLGQPETAEVCGFAPPRIVRCFGAKYRLKILSL
jgi:hypothetical protein